MQHAIFEAEPQASSKFYQLPVVSLRMVRDASVTYGENQVRIGADIAKLVMPLIMNLDSEVMTVLALDTKHKVVAIYRVAQGGLNYVHIPTREVFKTAILCNAAAIAIAHNHPSGDPVPSPEDVSVTELIVEAGKLLDIEVVDHVVIGFERFVSMRERGLGFGCAKGNE